MKKKREQLALAGLLEGIGRFLLKATDEGTPPGSAASPDSQADARILTLAGWLAGGGDKAPSSDTLAAAPRQLRTIFSAIELNGQRMSDENRQRAWLPLKPLAVDEEVLFPKEACGNVDMAYRTLANGFSQGWKKLKRVYDQSGSLSTYLESLLLLMQRYTWAVPYARSETAPDASLYDHSRMTAALAAAMADMDDSLIAKLLDAPKTNDTVALLVGGDVSGMQEFLYTVSSKGAASALRGRSFYLQLLTEAIARYVLRRLELPITNLIYQGGGNFYILAQASHQEKLKEIQRHISRVLLQHHRGALYVALAGAPLRGQDFFDGRIGAAWGRVAEQQQSMKLRRFSELDENDLKWLFTPLGDGGNEDKQCQVCGREHPGTEKDGDVRKCPPCRSYEELGKDLRKARYLALEHLADDAMPVVDLKKAPGDYKQVLKSFGMKAYLRKNVEDVPKTDNPVTLLAIKDEAMDALQSLPNRSIGRRFLVNVTPILTEEVYEKYRDKIEDSYHRNKENVWPDPVKPFSALAAQATGIKRLGVLRMDVDNMGKLFAEGMKREATLARVAGLSFAVSLYFEGWVEAIAEDEKYQDRLYSIYSGGDDLFFVGSWDAVVDFARQVREDLDRYAVQHPAITASGGMVLASSKYPLAQAAQEAGEAEHAAKTHRPAKNAFSFLGQPQSWERFGLEAKSSMNTVVGLTLLLEDLVAKGAPKSLIRQLSRLYTQYDAALQERARRGEDAAQGQPQALWGPWMWRGYYLLRRTAKRTKLGDIDKLAEALHDDDFRNMTWMGLAARWAELLTR